MQHETVDIIRAQVVERTRQRLVYLNAKRRCRIVGQPMILSTLISEFGLQKKIRPRHRPRSIRRSQSLSNSDLEIMLPLIGRIDATKPGAHSQFRESSRAVLLPGSSIKKRRRERRVSHAQIVPRAK